MPSSPTSPNPRKVIYIAGYGRSGSTLLDIALGMHPSIFGGGEVTALARHVWQHDEFCACGKSVSGCPLWSRAIAGWRPRGLETHQAFSRLGEAQRKLEALASPHRILRRKLADFHGEATVSLFDRLASTLDKPDIAIADSSKLPGRGLLLAKTPGIDLYVIHLVRDARAVAWSLSKSYEIAKESGVQRKLKPKSPAYVAMRWSAVNLFAERLCSVVGPDRSMRLRHEDFIENPARVMSRVASMAGLSDTTGRQAAGLLEPEHQVAGSRHRMLSSLRIKPDQEWRDAMPRSQMRLVTTLTAPLLSRYGYLSGPNRQGSWARRKWRRFECLDRTGESRFGWPRSRSRSSRPVHSFRAVRSLRRRKAPVLRA